MQQLNSLYLKPQADRRIKQGHLWIYSNEVDTVKSPLKSFVPGELVTVLAAKGQPLGLAFANPNALICGRILSRQVDRVINQGFFKHRLQRALSLRQQCFSAPYYRAVYGDADFLPGLVIDRYNEDLVVQITSAGLEALQEPLLQACEQVFKPRCIIVKNDHSGREIEGLEAKVEIVGDAPSHLDVVENDTRFNVPLTQGQKTGWFYDHRQNRAYLQSLVKGRSVLDVFSYFGGWGLEAAQAGAAQVICVDASQTAIDGVGHNAALNQCADRVDAIKGKAIDILKAMVADKQRFDVVVLDPPAFIKKRKDQKSGEAAYRHINELAIRLLAKEGLLVSASCSMPLNHEKLKDIVRSASRHLDRNAQLIYWGGQGADHPVHPAIPETEYLKAQFYRVFLD